MYTEPRYDRWTIPIAPLQFGKYSKSYLTIRYRNEHSSSPLNIDGLNQESSYNLVPLTSMT